jgi:hypothetical protein
MKRYLAPLGLTLALCALAYAQETTGDRVVVPARNTTHPRVVKASTLSGSITVNTYNGKEVIVESRPSRGSSRAPATYQGLRRIDAPRGLNVEEEDNVITVRTSAIPSANLVITVPPDTSLQLKSVHGSITVDGVHGDIEADTTHSGVNLNNVAGTVLASSTHGDVKVAMVSVGPGKPLSFSTVHGDIDVTLPADVKAAVKMSTVQGAIYSDFEIRMGGGQPVTEKANSPEGVYRVRIDRTINGTINGGGVEASFHTVHGKIMLRKK